MSAVVRSVLEHALALVGAHFGQLLLLEGAELVVRYTTNRPPRDLDLRVSLHDVGQRFGAAGAQACDRARCEPA